MSSKQAIITSFAEEPVLNLFILEEFFLFVYLAIYLFEIERSQVSGIKFYNTLDKKMVRYFLRLM